MSLRAKLYLLSGALIALSLVTGAVGYWSSKQIEKQYSIIEDINLPNTRYVMDMFLQFRAARAEVNMLAIASLSKEHAQEIYGKVGEYWKKIDDLKVKYEAVEFQPGEEKVWNKMLEQLKIVRSEIDKIVELHQKSSGPDSAEHKAMSYMITDTLYSHSQGLRDAFRELTDFHLADAKEKGAEAERAATTGIRLVLALLLFGGTGGVLFAYFVARNLVNTLSGISTSLSDSGLQVSSASSQISASSQSLSESATEQASALAQTAASIEEMNSMVRKNSENATKTAEQSEASKDRATHGQEVVRKMIESMGQINSSNREIMEQVNHSNSRIGEIVKVINEIGAKTKVINDIVFQTKLLSFNASVEAARAGEHGKGFAVVAEEVGNLAQMSGNAAKEISQMLQDSLNKVDEIVRETKATVEVKIQQGQSSVAGGERIAQECGDVLSEIVENVSSVSQMAKDIASACQEQAQGVAEITKAMNQLDQTTQQNAATSEEAASASEELSAQAESMKGIVESLVSTITGGRGGSAGGSQPPPPMAKRSNIFPMVKKSPVRSGADLKPGAENRMKSVANGSTPDYDDNRFTDV